jgi:hypothetical protein
MGNKPADAKTPMTTGVETIYHDQQCGLQQPQAVWVQSEKEYQILFRQLRQSYLGSQVKPPQVDWRSSSVILVGMGRKNTGGYGVTLIDNSAGVNNGVLQLAVQWQQPKPGMMLTQTLTSPCLLIKIPKGDYQRIEIKDQTGVTRLQVPPT